jgi:hypothetical protein
MIRMLTASRPTFERHDNEDRFRARSGADRAHQRWACSGPPNYDHGAICGIRTHYLILTKNVLIQMSFDSKVTDSGE